MTSQSPTNTSQVPNFQLREASQATLPETRDWRKRVKIEDTLAKDARMCEQHEDWEKHGPHSDPPNTFPNIVIRQILLFASNSSLVACMRVSSRFYQISSSILYRDIQFSNLNIPILTRGIHVSEPPKHSSAQSNPLQLKKQLLRQVKTLDINWLGKVSDQSSENLVKMATSLHELHTVRHTFPTFCLCVYSDQWCDACAIYVGVKNFKEDNRFDFMDDLRARKVVVAGVRNEDIAYIVRRLRPSFPHASTVTFHLSPDKGRASAHVGSVIRHAMSRPTFYDQVQNLRIMIAPWSPQVLTMNGRLPISGLEKKTYKATSLNDLVDFVASVTSGVYHTTIYLIEGLQESHDTSEVPGSRGTTIPTSDMMEHEMFVVHQLKKEDHRVEFRTLSDYLSEGVIDEIDEIELDRWRWLQGRRDYEADEEAAFGRSVCLEQKQWIENLCAESDHHIVKSPTYYTYLLDEFHFDYEGFRVHQLAQHHQDLLDEFIDSERRRVHRSVEEWRSHSQELATIYDFIGDGQLDEAVKIFMEEASGYTAYLQNQLDDHLQQEIDGYAHTWRQSYTAEREAFLADIDFDSRSHFQRHVMAIRESFLLAGGESGNTVGLEATSRQAFQQAGWLVDGLVKHYYLDPTRLPDYMDRVTQNEVMDMEIW